LSLDAAASELGERLRTAGLPTMAYTFHTRAALSGDDGRPSQAVPPLTSLHQGGVMIKDGPNVVLPDWYTPYPQEIHMVFLLVIHRRPMTSFRGRL
jgi:hypothetical protein